MMFWFNQISFYIIYYIMLNYFVICIYIYIFFYLFIMDIYTYYIFMCIHIYTYIYTFLLLRNDQWSNHAGLRYPPKTTKCISCFPLVRIAPSQDISSFQWCSSKPRILIQIQTVFCGLSHGGLTHGGLVRTTSATACRSLDHPGSRGWRCFWLGDVAGAELFKRRILTVAGFQSWEISMGIIL